MEIIKRGIAPSERKYQIDCLTCGSKLEFTDKDKQYSYQEMDAYIICPVCGCYLSLARAELVK